MVFFLFFISFIRNEGRNRKNEGGKDQRKLKGEKKKKHNRGGKDKEYYFLNVENRKKEENGMGKKK